LLLLPSFTILDSGEAQQLFFLVVRTDEDFSVPFDRCQMWLFISVVGGKPIK
jgi:hypothetical protein